MGTPSFYHWLEVAKRTDDPAGDFVEDARRDPPPNYSNFNELRRWIEHKCHYDPAVIAAASEAWVRYKHWLKRQAKKR